MDEDKIFLELTAKQIGDITSGMYASARADADFERGKKLLSRVIDCVPGQWCLRTLPRIDSKDRYSVRIDMGRDGVIEYETAAESVANVVSPGSAERQIFREAVERAVEHVLSKNLLTE